MRRLQWFMLICVSLLLGLITVTQTVSAETYSVPFRVVKDGSTETSVADQYFQKPAMVAIDGDHYVVIMTVRTTHNLGLFPVSVTDFNGQTPAISRTTHGNTDYYQYQFTATNLDSRLDGHMTVNIQAIRYNHYYGYGVVFDTSSLPKIGENKEPASSSSSSTNSTSESTVSSSTASSQSASGTSSSSKKLPVKVVPHVSVSKKTTKKSSPTKTNKFIFWPWLLVVTFGIAIVIFFERQSRK
ncbi:cell surface protein [Leuconostoc mesenteroides P45]|uniref:NEAT domain-containing protein n=1 Tax=Leuconostoc mesenteroides TaxID=1245 RepID=UPI0005027BFD|nr:NEAT domain-containing protein [Leuconostoc mesenteroides]KGB50956.1 cell surface protein [Leuconostoc mesenteroides P45]